MAERKRRLTVVLAVCLIMVAGAFYESFQKPAPQPPIASSAADKQNSGQSSLALQALGQLAVKGRAPKTGYKRTQFGEGWQQVGTCDVRNHVLQRDMNEVKTKSDADCTVLSGKLDDPYTAKKISFVRGPDSSDDVQIDHVVALSDAWQTGAQQLSAATRQQLANDSLELLAVDGAANQKKSDGDAATWLPPNKAYRCRYVARQIAVKRKYTLWVTEAEHDAIQRVLTACPDQQLPQVSP